MMQWAGNGSWYAPFSSLLRQYWCAIFNGIGFVICFFFMEETMYYRGKDVEGDASGTLSPTKNASVAALNTESDDEKKVGLSNTDNGTPQTRVYHKKTYLQKLKLITIIKERPFELFK